MDEELVQVLVVVFFLGWFVFSLYYPNNKEELRNKGRNLVNKSKMKLFRISPKLEFILLEYEALKREFIEKGLKFSLIDKLAYKTIIEEEKHLVWYIQTGFSARECASWIISYAVHYCTMAKNIPLINSIKGMTNLRELQKEYFAIYCLSIGESARIICFMVKELEKTNNQSDRPPLCFLSLEECKRALSLNEMKIK